VSFDEDEFEVSHADALSGASQRFAPEQMVTCSVCARRNPPTRMKCLYCGAEIPETEATKNLRRPVLKPLEEWEQGFNVVLLREQSADANENALRDAATLLRLERSALEGMLAANAALPLARVAAHDEAQMIERRLSELNFAVEIISDVDLEAESKVPQRVRQLRWTENDVTLTTNIGANSHVVRWKDVVLLVSGRLRHKRIEIEEGRGRRGMRNEVVDSREMFEDESVLDVYACAPGEGWRITAENFDFSCLGEEKNLLAAQNFRTLVAELRARASLARFDDEYAPLRPLLAHAWPLAERTEAGGLRRARPGRFHREAVTTVSNEAQFTRYSLLLHHLELRQGRRSDGK